MYEKLILCVCRQQRDRNKLLTREHSKTSASAENHVLFFAEFVDYRLKTVVGNF